MIQNPKSVIRAIEEYDQIGREAFLSKYGFGKSQNYFLLHNGKEYDPKAIVGAAFGYENPSQGPLTAEDFSGGSATVQNWLESLGFDVRVVGEPSKCYLLTWNPKRWEWDDFEVVAKRSAEGEIVAGKWSAGNNRSIQPGERVFLLRQAIDRGIIGAGYTTSGVVLEPHWDGSGNEAGFLTVDWETILNTDDVLPIDVLKDSDLEVNWDRIQGSGISAPAELEGIWQEHLAKLGRSVERLPNELQNPARYVEGAVRTISVNAYERNPKARTACLDHWGFDCAVCDFNFGAVYGELGEGFIHVHHLRDLATIGEEYEVNPVEDLRPVCPNCHAMLHKQTPAMSIQELKNRL